jgi:hypothetical protein
MISQNLINMRKIKEKVITPGLMKTCCLIMGINPKDAPDIISLLLSVNKPDQINNQIERDQVMKENDNTAKAFPQIFKEMTEKNEYAASNALMLGYNELESHYKFLRDELYERAITGSEERKTISLEMNTVLAVMNQRLLLTKAYIEAQTSSIDSEKLTKSVTTPVKDVLKASVAKEEKETIKFNPDKDSPAAMAAKIEANATPIPFKEVQAEVKRMLADEQEDAAYEYAKKILGAGDYTPKKQAQKAVKWDPAKLNGWFDHLKSAMADDKRTKLTNPNDNTDLKEVAEKQATEKEVTSTEDIGDKSALTIHRDMVSLRNKMIEGEIEKTIDSTDLTEKEEEQKKLLFAYDYKLITEGFQLTSEFRVRLLNFCMPEQTLKVEIEKLTALATRYLELKAGKETKDTTTPSDVVNLFFTYRGYSQTQIDSWVKAIENAGIEGLKDFKHFAVLAAPYDFFEVEALPENKMTDEEFTAIITDSEKTIEEIEAELIPLIAGTLIKLNTVYNPVYTDLHAIDVIEREYNAVIKKKELEDIETQQNEIDEYDLKNYESLVEQAVNANTKLEDFVKDHKDLLEKPNGEWRDLTFEKEIIAIDSEADLVAWLEERYQVFEAMRDDDLENLKENESVTEEKPPWKEGDALTEEEKEVRTELEKGTRVTILMSVLKDKIVSHSTRDNFMKDPLIEDMLKNGVVVNAYDDPKDKGKEIIFYEGDKTQKKSLTTWLKAKYTEVQLRETRDNKPKEITPVDKFDDGTIRIHSFAQLKSEGLKLKDLGKTREELIDWTTKNIIGRHLDDMQEGQEYKHDEMAISVAETMFDIKMPEQLSMSEEEVKNSLEMHLKDEKTSILTAVSAYKGMSKKMGVEVSLSKARDHVEQIAAVLVPEKLKALKDRTKENKSRQIFVEDKFSTANPEEWAKLKDITTMEDLYNSCKVYKDKDSWQTGLALALELIKLGNIADAKSWDKEQVKTWFNAELMADPIEESKSVEEVVSEELETQEEIEDEYTELYNDVSNASNPQTLSRAISEVMKNHENEKEARIRVITAIKNGKGKHTRKVSKMPEGDMHKMINKHVKNAETAKTGV